MDRWQPHASIHVSQRQPGRGSPGPLSTLPKLKARRSLNIPTSQSPPTPEPRDAQQFALLRGTVLCQPALPRLASSEFRSSEWWPLLQWQELVENARTVAVKADSDSWWNLTPQMRNANEQHTETTEGNPKRNRSLMWSQNISLWPFLFTKRKTYFSTVGQRPPEPGDQNQNHMPHDGMWPGDRDTASPVTDSHVKYKTRI